MTQRTRYFMVGSALIMTVGLSTGLVALYNGNLPLRASAIGPAELAYVPSDVGAVAYADVRAIMTSEFRQKLRLVLPTGESKDELLRETGIDLEHDIDSVVAGYGEAQPAEAGGIVLIRGRFNAALIETTATQHGGVPQDYLGKRLLVMSTTPGSEQPARDGASVGLNVAGGVAFLEPGLIAIGTTNALKRAIDTAASHQDVTKNTAMMQFVSEVNGAGNAWFVSRFDALSKTANLPAEIQSRLPAMQWLALSARIDGGVSGVLRAEANDDAAAENLRDVIRGGLAAARLVSGHDAKVDNIINSLQLTGTGKTVNLAFRVPAEILDIINGVAAMGHLNPTEHPAPKTIAK
jgi:hypothetical protein